MATAVWGSVCSCVSSLMFLFMVVMFFLISNFCSAVNSVWFWIKLSSFSDFLFISDTKGAASSENFWLFICCF